MVPVGSIPFSQDFRLEDGNSTNFEMSAKQSTSARCQHPQTEFTLETNLCESLKSSMKYTYLWADKCDWF